MLAQACIHHYIPNRMLKKSASVVLASSKDSTQRGARLTSSFAAAGLDGHFEHPASRSRANIIPKITVGFEHKPSFSAVY